MACRFCANSTFVAISTCIVDTLPDSRVAEKLCLLLVFLIGIRLYKLWANLFAFIIE